MSKKLVQLKNINNENIDPINFNYETRLQELENEINYSTTETIVGHNDNGKPVYRKCFNGNIADATTLAQNVAEFYGAKGYTEVISGTGSAIPYYEYSTTGFYLATVQFIPASHYIRFRVFRNGQAITAKANFYVEYTKTTD